MSGLSSVFLSLGMSFSTGRNVEGKLVLWRFVYVRRSILESFRRGGEGEKKKKKKLPLLCVPRERGFQDSHRICVRG